MRMNDVQINLSLGSNVAATTAALSPREASLVLIATALCKQVPESEFRNRIELALDNGCSLADVKEAILQLAIYAGFPKVLQSMKAFHRISSKLNAPLLDPTLNLFTFAAPSFNFFRQPEIQLGLQGIDADFAEMALANAVPLCDRPGLTAKERALVTLVSDVYSGVFDGPFQIHVEMALQSGATTDEIKDAIRIGSDDLSQNSVRTAFQILGAVQ